jgi:protein phosphatase
VITLRAGGATDVGMVRTNNQDQLLVALPLFAVADGMGGHAAGEVASRIAVEALRAAFSPPAATPEGEKADVGPATVVGPTTDAGPTAETGPTTDVADKARSGQPSAETLVSAVLRANRAVWERGQQEPSFRGMGTTLVALALVCEDGQDVLALVNVGDSRLYLLRDGELEQLTTDHTLVQELVDDGQISEAEAGIHPQRHVLTRALGVEPDVDVDLIEVLPYKSDRFLLCSDGLPREVSDSQIASILRRLADPEEAARELVNEARANGGNDNITVVVVDVVDDDDQAAEASAALASEPRSTSSTGAVREAEAEDEATATGGPPAPKPEKTAAPRPPRGHFLTVRVAFFVLLIVLLLAGGAAAVGFYARGSYFVGLQGDQLTIYRGRPGGVLWLRPTVEQRTGITTGDVLASRVGDLKAGKQEPTMADARQYVHNLQAEALAHGVGAAAPAAPTTTACCPPAGVPATTSTTTTRSTAAPGATP